MQVLWMQPFEDGDITIFGKQVSNYLETDEAG